MIPTDLERLRYRPSLETEHRALSLQPTKALCVDLQRLEHRVP